MVIKAPKVEFTRQQLEFLERQFPEFTGNAQTTHAEFLEQAGKRSVIRFLKHYMQKENS